MQKIKMNNLGKNADKVRLKKDLSPDPSFYII